MEKLVRVIKLQPGEAVVILAEDKNHFNVLFDKILLA